MSIPLNPAHPPLPEDVFLVNPDADELALINAVDARLAQIQAIAIALNSGAVETLNRRILGDAVWCLESLLDQVHELRARQYALWLQERHGAGAAE